jgi:hypothetical protein
MIWTRQRRPPGKVLYTILWIGAVLIGLGFLGNLPRLIPNFVENYSRDKVGAFGVLAGQMIVWAIGAFCILGIIDANKASREQGPQATPGYDAPSRGPVPPSLPSSTLPESASPSSSQSLKEELFYLESERVTRRISQEEYDNARAVLDTRLKLASEVAEAEGSQTVQPKEEQASEEPSVVGSVESNRVSPWIAVPVFAVLGWTGLLVFPRYGLSADSTGRWIGSLLIPFLIAYGIAGVKRRRNWGKFSFWLLVLGLVLPGLSNQKSLMNLPRSDMLRELIGSRPLEKDLPENELEMANATKAFYADITTFRKSQDKKLASLQLDLGQLYTGESFSSKRAMQRALDTVDAQLRLDHETLELLERMPEMARARIDQTKLSDSEKGKFMAGLMKSFIGSEFLATRRHAMVAESNWVDSVHDLYGFAIQHSSQIIVTKDAIGIANDAIRKSFNEKFSGSQSLLNEYLAAGKKADDIRSANLKSSGISEADLDSGK